MAELRNQVLNRSVTTLSKSQGPSIQMDPDDHKKTSSHGHNRNAGKDYGADVKSLIDAGDMRKAMAKEIQDVSYVATQLHLKTSIQSNLQVDAIHHCFFGN
ncbi:hypothetical protein AMD27_06370 [Acinetobacter sp. TGL-Y2]|nr:hypothetical protein AMD27_06370 [Acinetobacter sp. TGL-Y2]